MDSTPINFPIFLGVSQRAARRDFGWDLLGVSTLVMFPYLPQKLNGLQCLLGLNSSFLEEGDHSFRLLFTDLSRPENHAWSNLKWSVKSQDIQEKLPFQRGGFVVSEHKPTSETTAAWGLLAGQIAPNTIELLPTPAPPLLIFQPCSVLVEMESNGKRYPLGEFTCGFIPAPPLTDAERRAIESRPNAAKIICIVIGCNSCGSEAEYYTQLNPSSGRPKNVSAKSISISEAPDTWTCSCGKQPFNLVYIKQGIHDAFRHSHFKPAGDLFMQFTPLYEAGRIQDVIANYEQLIENATEEEPIQKYLENHSVFWGFLSPKKILHKPAVLTKKKADFGILTAQKVLFLVEIEKPTTKLTNQDGSVSAEIQRGADQIRDWQVVVGDHRLALLSQLDLKESEVQEIRYLLVGGLARRTTVAGLTKLRRSPLAPNTDFYCFDELSSFLHTLAGELTRL